MRSVLIALVAACGSSPPPAAPPAPPPPPDAAIDASPDAGVPAAVLGAPAWMFHYATKDRAETWTIQYAGNDALIIVASGTTSQYYFGTATDGATLALSVTTGSAKLALDCKRAKRPLSAKCNDTKAKPIDVLDCYHPDFKEPMPFGVAPGVEYVVSDACTGYRLAASK